MAGPDCVRGEGRQISIWPPSPVLRHDTTPASHRTRFPVNARGDMASVQPRAPVPSLPSVPLAGARRRSRMRTRQTAQRRLATYNQNATEPIIEHCEIALEYSLKAGTLKV